MWLILRRILFLLLAEQPALAPDAEAAAQGGEQQHDCQKTLEDPHFHVPSRTAKQEGFGGRTFNNGLDSDKPCDQ